MRKIEGEAPVMGNYFGLCVEGEVKVGDIVYVPDEWNDPLNKSNKYIKNFIILIKKRYFELII